MKKIALIILTLLFLCPLTACNSEQENVVEGSAPITETVGAVSLTFPGNLEYKRSNEDRVLTINLDNKGDTFVRLISHEDKPVNYQLLFDTGDPAAILNFYERQYADANYIQWQFTELYEVPVFMMQFDWGAADNQLEEVQYGFVIQRVDYDLGYTAPKDKFDEHKEMAKMIISSLKVEP